MNGLECTLKIREGIEGIDKQIPILMLTGKKDEEAEQKAIAAGVNVFMTKPFSIRSLKENINKTLK